MIGSFVGSIENMFELLLVFFFAAGLYYVFDRPRQPTDVEVDSKLPTDDVEVELSQIKGIWYCWSKDPVEGYSFVGQHEDKEVLSQQFIEYAKAKYNIS